MDLWIIATVVLAFAIAMFIFAKSQFAPQGTLWLPNENVYVDPHNTSTKHTFPSITEEPTVDLSIIVPSYNEEERLPVMLDETVTYLQQRKEKQPNFTYEILIVDDGSKDKTSNVGLEYAKRQAKDTIRVLTLLKNRGKGGAVKRGMLCARGKRMLMVDADGATKFDDLERLEAKLSEVEKDGKGIAIGSRAHMQEQAIATRSLLRNFLMFGFHMLVSGLCGGHGIKDTQCGFKLFTRKASELLFRSLHIERWAFDVELVFIAFNYHKIPMIEVPVNWNEIPGSKLSPFAASFQMAKDLFRIRVAYMFGFWSV